VNPPTRSQQQAVAARGNVLVVAGAGTGKTSTLVQRCVALLDEGYSLEHILMVAFTDAAAAEMRHRIREALQSKLRELESGAGPGEMATKREYFEKQLALLDAALISTLHSFCLHLVREHFYDLGIDPEVVVLDEQQTQPLIRQTLDALFERHYASDTEASRAVQSLVRVQGRGSDELIRALVLRIHRYAHSLAGPRQWMAEQLAIFHRAEPAQWREWFVESFRSWRELWLPALAAHAGNPAIDLTAAALRNAPSPPTLAGIAEALLSIKSADDNEDNWPRGSKKRVRDHIEDFFIEGEFLSSLAPRDESDPLAEDWELIRHHMIALLELAGEFTAAFSRAKRELGGVDFADIEQFALRLLQDPQTGGPTPTALARRRQFHHVFVDEYQDINAAQDAILTALSREGAEANRFLVGDVKQSIYRFRLADPGIFRDYERRWRNSGDNARRIPLADNFRSRRGILDFINRLFGGLMRADIGGVAYEALDFGNDRKNMALATGNGEDPRVEFHLIAKGDEENGDADAVIDQDPERPDLADLPATEREARLVALRLRELKEQRHEILDKEGGRFRAVEWSDMVVLLRSPAGRVEAFAQEFHRLGIPLEAARSGFFESTEINDLVCLLKLIDNPLQDIPLLAVLRSPLVGLSVDELAEIRSHNRGQSFWLTLRRFQREGEASSPARQKADLFLRRMELWRELIRQTSLSHCLETALAETHYEELLLVELRGEQRVANIRRLLDLARQYDPYQRQGLFRFIRFIEVQEEMEADLEPAPAQTGKGVRLMSIHKSKGLEFPVVVVAGLGWQFNLQDLRGDILLDEKYGLCPKVAPPDGEPRYPSLPYWLARQQLRRELLGEELRLLYVAMTRARDTLILTASSSSKSDPKWAGTEARPVKDQEMLSARTGLDWLKFWLPQVTRDAEWSGDREGHSQLLRWTIYSESDPRLAATAAATDGDSAPPVAAGIPGDSALVKLRERIAWQYPFVTATGERAKTSVTGLRQRRWEESEEAEAARFVSRNVFAIAVRTDHTLSAAGVGTAHHHFLQRFSLAKAGDMDGVRSEAERLTRAGLLSESEAAALDLKALARFWQSELGRAIRMNARAMQRELPFTARFSPADLKAAGLPVDPGLPPDEFIVVQGVIDLAVVLPGEIWLVDFKTDQITGSEVEEKVELYSPQLKLYALALERIYRRPVTARWLHFLGIGRSAPA